MKIRSQGASEMKRQKHQPQSDSSDELELPTEILELIFMKFTSHSDLFACARVNAHWRHATRDQRLWRSIYGHLLYPLSIPKRGKSTDWVALVREFVIMRTNIRYGRAVVKSVLTRTLNDSISSISLNSAWAVVNRDKNRRCNGSQLYNIISEKLEVIDCASLNRSADPIQATDSCCSQLLSKQLVYASRCSAHSSMYFKHAKLNPAAFGQNEKKAMKIMEEKDRLTNTRLIPNEDPKSNIIAFECTNPYQAVVFNINEDRAEYVYTTSENNYYYLCGHHLVVTDRGKATIINVKNHDDVLKIKFSWDGVPVCCLNHDQIILVGAREICIINLNNMEQRVWQHSLKNIDTAFVYNGLLVVSRWSHLYFLDIKNSAILNALILSGSASVYLSADAQRKLVCRSTDGLRVVDFGRTVNDSVYIRVLEANAPTKDIKMAHMPRCRVMPWIQEQEKDDESLISFYWRIQSDERYSLVFASNARGHKNKLATKLYKEAMTLPEAQLTMPFLAYEFKIDTQLFPDRILLLNRTAYPLVVIGTAYCLYEKWNGQRWELATPQSWNIRRRMLTSKVFVANPDTIEA